MVMVCPACAMQNADGSVRCRRCATPLVQQVWSSSPDSIWRDGEQLVLRKGAQLPPRCVRCNAPTEGSGYRRTFYWHPQLLYLIALFALLIYAIVALIVRKSALVFVGLCPEHAQQRKRAQWGGAALFVAGFLSLIAAFPLETAALGWAGAAMMIGAGIWAAMGNRSITPVHIDDNFARFKGACSAYLDQLTPWTSYS